jgi:hypothetical protein
MKKYVLSLIIILSVSSLYSQFLYNRNKKVIKGKVKKTVERYYYPHSASKRKRTKVVSEYDSLRRKTYYISYYIKKNPNKEYFYYDSLGNINLRIYQNKDRTSQYMYQYQYDVKKRIISQVNLKDSSLFFRRYDNIIYNNEDLPIRYIVWHDSNRFTEYTVYYPHGSINEYVECYEYNQQPGIIDTSKLTYSYNEYGFLIKAIDQSIIFVRDAISNEYHWSEKTIETDYTAYKYDKQGNWIKCRQYLNYCGQGSRYRAKIRRKIYYYKD